MRVDPVRRRLATVLALLVATTGLALAGPGAAFAAPPPLAAPGDSGDDGEGGSKSLTDQLEDASKGFVEAQETLEGSRKRQQTLVTKLKELDTELGPRQAALDDIVRQSYQRGRLGPMGALLTASSTGTMMDRAETLETIAVKQDRAVRDLKDAKTQQEQAKTAIDVEIRKQQAQVTVMAKRKTQAENALKTHNAKVAAANAAKAVAETGSSPAGNSSTAESAPRNSDGSLVSESCSIDDPTSGGCITPRTLHAMKQAQAAGFTRFVACFRTQNSGEHPKGRACDFAADKTGFGGVATGSSKTYGNNLADYFIDNSSRLGVLYVIWFNRIWLPSSGWKAYSGGNGDPSSDHTNHVHLSMR
ncbi:coiled-coil domain-containing protein [Actinoplanes sp. NPDC051494]|uniref:coiled-coil domain-containing protein n=1 Tax=Actinoplanes sp. NPDC051494 TaxID=3363907 RepID=UPI0037948216